MKPVNLKMIHVYRQGTSAGSVYVARNFSKELAEDPTIDPCTEYVGAYVPERTCATCRYNDSIHPRAIGFCSRIDESPSSVATIYGVRNVDANIRLQVAHDFGCVLHEEKEG